MKCKTTLFLVSPATLSVDVLIRHIWRGFSTHQHLFLRGAPKIHFFTLLKR